MDSKKIGQRGIPPNNHCTFANIPGQGSCCPIFVMAVIETVEIRTRSRRGARRAVSLDMVSGGFSNAIETEGLFGRGEAVMPSIGKDAGAAKNREEDRRLSSL